MSEEFKEGQEVWVKGVIGNESDNYDTRVVFPLYGDGSNDPWVNNDAISRSAPMSEYDQAMAELAEAIADDYGEEEPMNEAVQALIHHVRAKREAQRPKTAEEVIKQELFESRPSSDYQDSDYPFAAKNIVEALRKAGLLNEPEA